MKEIIEMIVQTIYLKKFPNEIYLRDQIIGMALALHGAHMETIYL